MFGWMLVVVLVVFILLVAYLFQLGLGLLKPFGQHHGQFGCVDVLGQFDEFSIAQPTVVVAVIHRLVPQHSKHEAKEQRQHHKPKLKHWPSPMRHALLLLPVPLCCARSTH